MKTMEAIETNMEQKTYSKPHFKKGFFAGQLTEVKTENAEGEQLYDNFGNQQAILVFSVFKTDDNNVITVPVTIQENNVMTDAKLPYFLAIRYKITNEETKQPILDSKGQPTYRSAFGPGRDGTGTKSVKILKALGWNAVPGSKILLSDYIGQWVELNIDDYELKDQNKQPTGKKASCINGIKKFEGTVPKEFIVEKPIPEAPIVAKEEDVVVDDEYFAKTAQLQQQLKDGMMTEKEYLLAIEGLRKEDRRNAQ